MRMSTDDENFRSNVGGSGWSRPFQSDEHADSSVVKTLIDLRGRLLNFPERLQHYMSVLRIG
jgi:hypothetical protein